MGLVRRHVFLSHLGIFFVTAVLLLSLQSHGFIGSWKETEPGQKLQYSNSRPIAVVMASSYFFCLGLQSSATRPRTPG